MKKCICKKCGKEFEWHRYRLQCTECCPIPKKYNSKEEQLSARKKQISDNVIKRRKRNKNKIVNICGTKCCLCGYDKCVEALEFHHINRNEKDFGLGKKLTSYSWEKVKNEARKTILVCANCHREIHQGYYDEELLHSKLEQNQKLIDCYSEQEKLIHVLKTFLKNRIDNEPKIPYVPKRKVERPETYEQFVQEMDELNWNYCAMGRKYGVSDNAIRKWEKAYKNK